MLPAREGFACAATMLPDLEGWGIRVLTSQGVSDWPWPNGQRSGEAPPEPERPSVIRCGPLAARRTAMTGHRPQETAFRFPPEVFLGGFLFTRDPAAKLKRHYQRVPIRKGGGGSVASLPQPPGEQ